VIIDEYVKTMLDKGTSVMVDYVDTSYGAGFIVRGGSTC
jgi:hypothetical protein